MQETSFLKTQQLDARLEAFTLAEYGDRNERRDPLRFSSWRLPLRSLKNTPEELRDQEKELQKALIGELKNTPLIVTGYMLEILLHGRTNR